MNLYACTMSSAFKFINMATTYFPTECYFLVYWPDENSYSELPDSKILEPKDPVVGQMVKVKEDIKTF